jgi:23S rRNA pseudouridine1911/1915/1917 synthase
MEVVYEDNHIIIVSKRIAGRSCKATKPATVRLSETVKEYIKIDVAAKPGNVFLGVTLHRLDRPVWGLVVFAKTSKALARLNDMFRDWRRP